jgi:hypothetical protein
MLLSVERVDRGSLCLPMTRGHVAAPYGLVQAVLPASVWNMANGELRFPRNLGDPGVNAPHDTDCIGGADSRMVCAQALLKLARWCQQRSQSASGGEPCPTPRKTEFPPAPAGGGDVCGAGAALDDAVAVHASERPANTESRRRSATANANDRPGGVG